MNLARACLKYNRVTFLLLAWVVLFGIWSYLTIPRLEDPSFTFRHAVVVTPFPGASPLKVEKLVTDVLEESIREIGEVEVVTSQSKADVSVIFVEVGEQYTDVEPIWQDLRNKVSDARPELPDGSLPPQVNDEYGDVYGILLALTGRTLGYEDLEHEAEALKERLLAMDEVAKVKLHGDQPERIFVELSNDRMARLGLSPRQLIQTLQAQNAIQPSGSATLGQERVTIEATGEFTSLDDIRRASLRLPGQSETVFLGDVADIRRGTVDPPEKLVRFNGEKCVLLAVSMVRNGNIVSLGERIDGLIEAERSRLPQAVSLDRLVFQPDFVKKSIADFSVNLLEAFGFVVGVMLLFVGWRTGLIAGVLVPLAMLACISLMPLFGVKLQIVSIGALIVSLGILVDNGVVVSENILVRISSGMDRMEAVTGAVRRLWLPLLTSSLTTILVFLPIPLAQSKTGEYTGSLFTVITLTLLCSWLLSLTYVPTLSYYVLKAGSKGKRNLENAFYRGYRRLLLACLKHRVSFLCLAALLVAVAVWGFRYVPRMFFPPNERQVLTIELWQPYGSDIRTTLQRVSELEASLRSDREVDSVGTFVGYGGPRWYLPLQIKQKSPNFAFLVVKAKSLQGLAPLKDRIHGLLADGFPDTRASVRLLERGPPVGAPIQVRISGPGIETMYRLRDRVEEIVREAEGVKTVWDDWGEWSKKMVLEVHQEKAKRAGLSTEEIALSLQSQYSGLEVSEYRQEEDIIPIVIRAGAQTREELWKIDGVNVFSSASKQRVPLLQVAEPKLTWQPSNVRRRNGQRTMTVKADIRSGLYGIEILQQSIRPKIEGLLASKAWPKGYSLAFGGEFEESEQANRSILLELPLALGLIILVLAVQFNSFRRVLIIGLTLPPLLVGVTAGMIITQAPFGFMALLGIISLVGILVNNGIMVIDQIELERSKGLDLENGLVLAAQKRLRPILMTASTTILGLIPLSLQGGELWRPMANSLISGLAFSTLLTLVLCPVLYAIFFRANFRGYSWDPEVAGREDR